MNHGAFDDPMDYGEVPGHGPTVILAHLDGDEVALPRAVEHRLRDDRACLAEFRDVWRKAREHEDATRPEPPPAESPDDYGADDEDESADDDYGTDDEEPRREPRPTVVALIACVLCLIVVECPLIALRVGGALEWSWGWVLAPLWVPVTAETVSVAAACVWLAAMDERDAARRRNRVGKVN